jgi:5-methylcytosine-specific restriction endonuclease McrA
MAVIKATKDDLYARAGGKCECIRRNCYHQGRCNEPLGTNWEVCHKTGGGSDSLENLEALCFSCHKNTGSFGKPGR